jgi:hypothetical protein
MRQLQELQKLQEPQFAATTANCKYPYRILQLQEQQLQGGVTAKMPGPEFTGPTQPLLWD